MPTKLTLQSGVLLGVCHDLAKLEDCPPKLDRQLHCQLLGRAHVALFREGSKRTVYIESVVT